MAEAVLKSMGLLSESAGEAADIQVDSPANGDQSPEAAEAV